MEGGREEWMEEGKEGWMNRWMGGWVTEKKEREGRSVIPSWKEKKSMGSAWGLLFNKSFHLNNPESITIKYITFLSSLLPGIYLFCFVLARLNLHILFVQAIHQICQAENSWGFLSLAEKRNSSLSYHMHSYFYLTLSWNTPAAEHIEYFIDHKMCCCN